MNIVFKVCPRIDNGELNQLFSSAWPAHTDADFRPLLDHALVFVCAYERDRLVGFAKVIGDGGIHGFLLDPTVVPARRRQGIGKQLVALCIQEARMKGIQWIHVDFEASLEPFYTACGFRHTDAGLLNLKNE